MDFKKVLNQEGITLIELLIALTILGLVVGGIYRLFIAQNRAYGVQDQVAEVQQNIRSAEDVLTRQLRMAGYDDDNTTVKVTKPIFPGDNASQVRDDAVTIQYEDIVLIVGTGGIPVSTPFIKTVTFLKNGSNLEQQVYNNGVLDPTMNCKDDGGNVVPCVLLENVTALNFTYGVDSPDTNGTYDGAVDLEGLSAADVSGSTTGNIIAIAFTLAAGTESDPNQPDFNPDFQVISPRRLSSRVSLRNPMMKHILK